MSQSTPDEVARPVVTTETGAVAGIVWAGLAHHRGVPYAAPPVDGRRFRSPQPHPGWTGVRDAAESGPIASQVAVPAAAGAIGSEDCLRLDISAPTVRDEALPVMVWFHGGGFVAGAAAESYTRPDAWCRRGIVVVAVTYRLGALGWLRLAGSDSELGDGNLGLQDQVAALQWVHRNIAGFGGDPGRVTVIGQSAGAMSVAALMAAPSAAGLFHGAVLQSGAADHTLGIDEADELTERMVAVTGRQRATELLDLPAPMLLEAQQRLLAPANGTAAAGSRADRFLLFAPVAGTPTLPRHPLEALRTGTGNVVPTIVGANRDEMRTMVPVTTTEAEVRRWMAAIGAPEHEVWERYQESVGPDPHHIVAAMRTDLLFRLPGARFAAAVDAAGGRAWHYDFRWSPRALPFGAAHGIELRFVFATLHDPEAVPVHGSAPASLALAMSAAWEGFLVSGRPGTPKDCSTQEWHPYHGDGPTVVFDERIQEVHGLRSELRGTWGGRLAPP